jgi:hypothetical protein
MGAAFGLGLFSRKRAVTFCQANPCKHTPTTTTMIVVGQLSQFSKEFIYLCEPVSNNQQRGRFIRILYMTPYFALNGISVQLPLRQYTIERYFNKLKCTFSVMHHQNSIQQLHQMEVDILAQTRATGKTPVYRLAQQMSEGCLRVYPPNIMPVARCREPSSAKGSEPSAKGTEPCAKGTEPSAKGSAIESLAMVINVSGIWEDDVFCGLTYRFVARAALPRS